LKVAVVVTPQRLEHAVAGRERAQCVGEARVLGRRKGEVREPDLAQPAQPLQRRAVDQGHLGIVELDEVVDRIEDALHDGSAPILRRHERPRGGTGGA